jgi:GNAT superfamily N-acetyltransferase
LQLSRRTDHVETWSPPYVDSYCSRVPLEIRPAATNADHEASLDVWNAVFPRRRISLDEVLSYKAAVEHSIELLAESDGRVVGMAHGGLEAGSRHPESSIAVLHERRGRGVGTALYGELSAWARSIGAEALYSAVEEADPESLDWAQRHGFVERARESRLVLELDGLHMPAVRPPDGIEIVTWAERPDASGGMHAVYVEASPDIPGQEDEPAPPYDEWLRQHMQGAGDRAEATFVALAGDEVVGYSKFSLTDAQPDIAYHDLTAVKRAWRGRGIARALKATQIGWAKHHGYRRLETTNEERNAPIRRLNEQFGYGLEPGRVLIVGPLAP